MSEELIKSDKPTQNRPISRRDFLKLVGVASGVATLSIACESQPSTVPTPETTSPKVIATVEDLVGQDPIRTPLEFDPKSPELNYPADDKYIIITNYPPPDQDSWANANDFSLTLELVKSREHHALQFIELRVQQTNGDDRFKIDEIGFGGSYLGNPMKVTPDHQSDEAGVVFFFPTDSQGITLDSYTNVAHPQKESPPKSLQINIKTSPTGSTPDNQEPSAKAGRVDFQILRVSHLRSLDSFTRQFQTVIDNVNKADAETIRDLLAGSYRSDGGYFDYYIGPPYQETTVRQLVEIIEDGEENYEVTGEEDPEELKQRILDNAASYMEVWNNKKDEIARQKGKETVNRIFH